jgi:hypothetical protein
LRTVLFGTLTGDRTGYNKQTIPVFAKFEPFKAFKKFKPFKSFKEFAKFKPFKKTSRSNFSFATIPFRRTKITETSRQQII